MKLANQLNKNKTYKETQPGWDNQEVVFQSVRHVTVDTPVLVCGVGRVTAQQCHELLYLLYALVPLVGSPDVQVPNGDVYIGQF